MSAPEEPVIHDVIVKWTGRTTTDRFENVIVGSKPGGVLALTDPADPENFILVPLNSGNVLYAEAKRSQGTGEQS